MIKPKKTNSDVLNDNALDTRFNSCTEDEIIPVLIQFLSGIYSNISKPYSGDFFYHKDSLDHKTYFQLKRNLDLLHHHFPKKLYTVFEDENEAIENITANAWVHGNRGLIRMKFNANTNNLPLHIHEYSDRVVIIERGVGFGYYDISSQPKSFRIERIPISKGDYLVFPRGVPHTFQSTSEDIVTLTYHSPFIPFEDTKSFEKILSWYPYQFKDS